MCLVIDLLLSYGTLIERKIEQASQAWHQESWTAMTQSKRQLNVTLAS